MVSLIFKNASYFLHEQTDFSRSIELKFLPDMNFIVPDGFA